ncbi:protein-tyrosine phosphatase, partial [Pseudohyphozyma bogoriensis]
MAALLHPTNSRSSSSSSAVPPTPTPLSRTTLSPKVTLITASEYKELHAAYTGESLPVKQVFPWMHKGAEVEGSASWRYFSDGKGGRGVARPEYRGLTTIFCPALPPSPSSSPTSSPTKLSSHARKHSNTKRQQPVPHAPMMGSSFSAYSSDEDGVSSSESEFSDDEDEDPTLHSPTTTLGSSRPSHELISSYPSSLLLSPLSQSFLPPAFDPKPHVVNLRGFRDVPLKYARLSDIVVYSREGLYLGVEGKGEVGEVDITKVVYGEELRLNENLVETANLAVKAVEKEASAQNKRRGGHVAEERRVWVVIDSFETFEAHHPELVAIDSEGYHRNKLDWFAREKEEMRVLTEGSEIGRGVYLGNSQDVPLPPPVKRGMREGSSGWESENSSVEGETGYGGVGGEGENERGVAICIEAHESAKMPSPHKLQDADDHLSSYEETLEQNTWVDVAISSAATISSRPASPSSTYPSSGNHTAKRTTTTLIPPNSSLVHLSVPSTLSHLNPTQLSNAINGLINLLSFIHSQSNPPPHAHRLPRRVLMHCGDGYTETSLLALSYVMYERRCTLPEAYLVLQREGRSFFVYPAEVKVLLEVERRVSEFWEREDRMRGVSGEKEGEGESSGMERSDSGFVDGDGVAELEWARLMKVKQADKKQVVQEKQDAMKTSCPVEYPWFFSENWEGHFPSRILPFL